MSSGWIHIPFNPNRSEKKFGTDPTSFIYRLGNGFKIYMENPNEVYIHWLLPDSNSATQKTLKQMSFILILILSEIFGEYQKLYLNLYFKRLGATVRMKTD